MKKEVVTGLVVTRIDDRPRAPSSIPSTETTSTISDAVEDETNETHAPIKRQKKKSCENSKNSSSEKKKERRSNSVVGSSTKEKETLVSPSASKTNGNSQPTAMVDVTQQRAQNKPEGEEKENGTGNNNSPYEKGESDNLQVGHEKISARQRRLMMRKRKIDEANRIEEGSQEDLSKQKRLRRSKMKAPSKSVRFSSDTLQKAAKKRIYKAVTAPIDYNKTFYDEQVPYEPRAFTDNVKVLCCSKRFCRIRDASAQTEDNLKIRFIFCYGNGNHNCLGKFKTNQNRICLLYTSPSPRDA